MPEPLLSGFVENLFELRRLKRDLLGLFCRFPGAVSRRLDTLRPAGLNPTHQFVGSYEVNITPTADGRAEIEVYNVTSFNSAAYHITGYDWERGDGRLDAMGNVGQSYIWTESMGQICGER